MLTLADKDFKVTIIIIVKCVEIYMIKINVNIRNLRQRITNYKKGNQNGNSKTEKYNL